MTKVWINGKLFDKADAKISVFDHGLLYGDGVFEGIRIYNAKVFRLREHIDRLYESARHIALELPLGREQMTQAVLDTVKANAKQDGYIRLVVTRGGGSLGLDPNRCSDPQVIVIVDDISLYPVEFYEKGLEVITASIVRNHANAVNPRIKSLNYLNNILAKIEAVRAGCQEAVMLNPNGEVAECTGDNIFLVKRGVLRTPHLAAGILEGVTRNAVIELAREAKVPVQEMALTRHDIYSADECFLTGTAAEVVAVVKCDGRPIGNGKPGPVTRQLRERFHQLARQ
ncbi:MAG TPA: branched-chain-amino-acid transaminase [Gemmataceae bacterium]|jgi:branched-chain amino acid aminotransferase